MLENLPDTTDELAAAASKKKCIPKLGKYCIVACVLRDLPLHQAKYRVLS